VSVDTESDLMVVSRVVTESTTPESALVVSPSDFEPDPLHADADIAKANKPVLNVFFICVVFDWLIILNEKYLVWLSQAKGYLFWF